jgi:hypothetical protein
MNFKMNETKQQRKILKKVLRHKGQNVTKGAKSQWRERRGSRGFLAAEIPAIQRP